MGEDIPLAALIGILVALLLLSAFFSGSETALVSLNRYQLRHKARQGHRGAILAERLLQRPDRMIGQILLGNNLVNFSAASLVAIIALKIGGEPAVAIGTLILTLVVLIFSETAPKTLAALPKDVSTELGPDATGVGWVYQYALRDTSGQRSLADLRSYQDWYDQNEGGLEKCAESF